MFVGGVFGKEKVVVVVEAVVVGIVSVIVVDVVGGIGVEFPTEIVDEIGIAIVDSRGRRDDRSIVALQMGEEEAVAAVASGHRNDAAVVVKERDSNATSYSATATIF